MMTSNHGSLHYEGEFIYMDHQRKSSRPRRHVDMMGLEALGSSGSRPLRVLALQKFFLLLPGSFILVAKRE